MKMKITETNFEYDEQKRILYEGDWYHPVNYISSKRPTITGSPKITYEDFRMYIGRGKISRKPAFGALQTPKDCSIYHILNFPIKKWGSPQVQVNANYGQGKSVLIDWIEANWLAGPHRIIQFDDTAFEARGLAPHGYFSKDGYFHPFKIKVFIPKGYKFKESANHNPLWNYRKNVELVEFESITDIIEAMKLHTMVVVYKEAFEEESLVRFWIDIMQELRSYVSVKKSYIFADHELGDLFPESPSGELYSLLKTVEKIIRRFRKYRIGILSAFHASYDVKYSISQKFGFTIQGKPVNRKSLSAMELDAKKFKRGDFNISQSGYWRKHHINEFPTISDEYRLIPNDRPWYYKDGEMFEIDEEQDEKKNLPKSAKETAKIFTYWYQGLSEREISRRSGVARHTVKSMMTIFESDNESLGIKKMDMVG